jgi:hypothetical protein
MPARETHATPSRLPEPAEPPQPAARPRVELSPRALAQAAIVEAMRSPGRGRPPPTGEGDSPAPKNAEPAVASPLPKNADPVVTSPSPKNVDPSVTASAQAANTPAVATSPMPVELPVAATTAVVADASPSLTKPIAVSPAPSKPTPSSRAAADILRQRQYALGSDASPAGDIVPESAATFDTLIALRKADGAFEGHASPAGEHESAAPVSAGIGVAFTGIASATALGGGEFAGRTSASRSTGALRVTCAVGTSINSCFGACSCDTNVGARTELRTATSIEALGTACDDARGELSTMLSATAWLTAGFGTACTSLLPPSTATSAIEAASSNAGADVFFSSSRAPSPGLPCSPETGEFAGVAAGFATAANSASKPSAAGVPFFTGFAKPCA